jgi:hypothetical protein
MMTQQVAKPRIPTAASSRELADYVDRLLDEALEETFPASDAVAIPSPREIEPR